jgi:hypothetical protein
MLSDSLYEAKFNHAGEIMQVGETERNGWIKTYKRYCDSMRLNGI